MVVSGRILNIGLVSLWVVLVLTHTNSCKDVQYRSVGWTDGLFGGYGSFMLTRPDSSENSMEVFQYSKELKKKRSVLEFSDPRVKQLPSGMVFPLFLQDRVLLVTITSPNKVFDIPFPNGKKGFSPIESPEIKDLFNPYPLAYPYEDGLLLMGYINKDKVRKYSELRKFNIAYINFYSDENPNAYKVSTVEFDTWFSKQSLSPKRLYVGNDKVFILCSRDDFVNRSTPTIALVCIKDLKQDTWKDDVEVLWWRNLGLEIRLDWLGVSLHQNGGNTIICFTDGLELRNSAGTSTVKESPKQSLNFLRYVNSVGKIEKIQILRY